MAFTHNVGGGDFAVRSEINVTPLVDVCLVLLIIFMVVTPMLQSGVDVSLPETFTSVNTFRLVFREYFGADLPPLPDRSYTWPDDGHIYDFRDVTGEIGGPSD